MGTVSTKKIIKQVSGVLVEEAALLTSAGAGDADRVPALNAAGILDDSFTNASATVAANKLAKLNASGILSPALINGTVTSTGASDSAKVAQLDGSGRLDSTLMPIGIGADTASIITSEAVVSGEWVNIWSSTGFKVRKADASVAGKHAMGFVLVGASSGAAAVVYFEGTNTAVTGQTPGDVYLSTTAGLGVATPPSAAGNVVQAIGFAISATAVNFQSTRPVTLA